MFGGKTLGDVTPLVSMTLKIVGKAYIPASSLLLVGMELEVLAEVVEVFGMRTELGKFDVAVGSEVLLIGRPRRFCAEGDVP